MEALTDEVEGRARGYLERIEELGGAARAIEFMQEEIHKAAYGFQQDVEAGRRKVVGVNEQVEDERAPRIGQPDYSALEDGQKGRLAALKERRDDHLVREALRRIRDAAGTDANLMPPIIAAVRAEVTLGEISDVLRDVWGTYDAFVVDAVVDTTDDGTRVTTLDLTIVAGERKGEVVTVTAGGLRGSEFDLIGMPATLTVTDGAPAVRIDR